MIHAIYLRDGKACSKFCFWETKYSSKERNTHNGFHGSLMSEKDVNVLGVLVSCPCHTGHL